MNNHEVAFNQRWELNFRYSCNCLLIADADGDGNLEVVAGSRDGVLCVYKLGHVEPWKSTIGGPFGLITALAVGDLFNRNVTILVSISADGACYAFKLGASGSQGSSVGSDEILQACFKQFLPSNIKGAYIGDIDGDGRSELVVALTDRVVRTYRFVACSTTLPSSTGPLSAMPNSGRTSSTAGSGFCCGYLVALNKWESPAQITAFSVCPSNSLPEAGVTVLLSQPGDKYLLLKPKLCPENDPADNLSDISVIYCETNKKASHSTRDGGRSGTERTEMIEHRGHKMGNSKSDGSSGKRKRRLFVAANSNRIDLFHLISRYVTIIDHNHEYRIDYPSQIFSLTSFKVPSSSLGVTGSPNSDHRNSHDLLFACDWKSNVYVCNIDNGDNTSPRHDDDTSKEQEKQHRINSMITMKVFGPVMCFAAGYNQSIGSDDILVAVSTCEDKVFVYSVHASKLLKVLACE